MPEKELTGMDRIDRIKTIATNLKFAIFNLKSQIFFDPVYPVHPCLNPLDASSRVGFVGNSKSTHLAPNDCSQS
jgi:hypothetical protein